MESVLESTTERSTHSTGSLNSSESSLSIVPTHTPLWDSINILGIIGEVVSVTFGVLGNVMILVIMHRLPASSSTVFFNTMAWCDLTLLALSPLQSMLVSDFNATHLVELSSWTCKLNHMAVTLLAALSPWALVSFSALRAASVLRPLRVNGMWTIRKSQTTVGVLTVVFFLINSHFLYGFDLASCFCCHDAVSEMYAWFYEEVWMWVDMAECSLLPLLLLVVSNSVLLKSLLTSIREVKDLSVVLQGKPQDSRQHKVSSLSVTLMVTSVSFFLLTSPITVYLMLHIHHPCQGSLQCWHHDLFQTVSMSLWNLNCSVNFYLYILTGAKFRAEFKKTMFACWSCLVKVKKPTLNTNPCLQQCQ